MKFKHLTKKTMPSGFSFKVGFKYCFRPGYFLLGLQNWMLDNCMPLAEVGLGGRWVLMTPFKSRYGGSEDLKTLTKNILMF